MNGMPAIVSDGFHLATPHRRGKHGRGRAGVPATLLGVRIRERRTGRAMTQEDLGRMCGTLGNRIGDWELGHVTPSLASLARIARALDTSVSELLRGVM